jgi:Flp pilus assembly protein TadG
MNCSLRKDASRKESGQILWIFAVALPILILFVGLSIDVGVAWVTKALLSSAVDAAALAGMRNVNLGQTQAKAIAQSAFNVNYGAALNRDVTAPVVSIVFSTDSNSNTVVNVGATATLNTFFIKLLPGYNIWNVSSSAQATRPKLIMSLVLDKSGSMNLNGGAQVLPSAVVNFIGYFDDVSDKVAMVSFSSVSTTDVTIRTTFKSPITTAVNSMAFGGATYAQGGLLDGQTQINGVTTVSGQNVVKVAVFFTDGWANTLQDILKCPANTLLNYGGCAPPEAAVGWCSGISFLSPTTGSATSCGATTFPSQLTGTNQSLTQTNIANDANYRAVLAANSMRAQNIVIYAIGLGDKISQPFLLQVANDPGSSTFDSSQPVGQAVFAPTAADLQGVFQTIASKILLRLS